MEHVLFSAEMRVFGGINRIPFYKNTYRICEREHCPCLYKITLSGEPGAAVTTICLLYVSRVAMV